MTIGVSVRLLKDFSVVRETLERIGIVNQKTKTIYPSCYCVECKTPETYKIVHFKELFPLFDRETDFNQLDKVRRNTAAMLLKNWGLIEFVNSAEIDEILSEKISVVKFKDKSLYTIVHKFKFSTHVVVE